MQGCGGIWGKSFAGQGKSTFKGPEAGGEELHGPAGDKRGAGSALEVASSYQSLPSRHLQFSRRARS